MRTRVIIGTLIAAGAVLLVSPSSAPAHHAFAAEFDANKPIKFVGATVTKVMTPGFGTVIPTRASARMEHAARKVSAGPIARRAAQGIDVLRV